MLKLSILSHLANLESSCIYKLSYGGSIVGFRVKYYDVNEKKFQYFDFEVSYVKRRDQQGYLNSHAKEFETLEMIESNGVVCTQEEIDGTITVKEFTDEDSASRILDLVIRVLELK